jgi:hypothetical protein
MGPSVDRARLQVNPFDFQLNPETSSKYLDETSAELHAFLAPVLKDDDDFYRIWNGFAGRQDELFRLIMAARTWARVSRMSNSGMTVLFGIFFLEAVAGYDSPEFPVWLRKHSGAGVGPFTGEQIETLHREYQEDTGAMRSVRNLLQENLSAEEKVELLMGFEFARPYRLGEKQEPWNHLHCKKEMCGSWCDPPPADQVDVLFGKLVNRIYEMRSAVVHRNAFVLFASEPDESEGIVTVPLMYDAYFLRAGKMMGYSTHIETKRLTHLFKTATARFYLARSP